MKYSRKFWSDEIKEENISLCGKGQKKFILDRLFLNQLEGDEFGEHCTTMLCMSAGDL